MEWVVAVAHTIDGSKETHHNVPGRTPRHRLAFKQACLRNVLEQVHASAAARGKTTGAIPHLVVMGDLNLAKEQVQEVVEVAWPSTRRVHAAGLQRDFVISSLPLVEAACAVWAHDRMHHAVAATVLMPGRTPAPPPGPPPPSLLPSALSAAEAASRRAREAAARAKELAAELMERFRARKASRLAEAEEEARSHEDEEGEEEEEEEVEEEEMAQQEEEMAQQEEEMAQQEEEMPQQEEETVQQEDEKETAQQEQETMQQEAAPQHDGRDKGSELG